MLKWLCLLLALSAEFSWASESPTFSKSTIPTLNAEQSQRIAKSLNEIETGLLMIEGSLTGITDYFSLERRRLSDERSESDKEKRRLQEANLILESERTRLADERQESVSERQQLVAERNSLEARELGLTEHELALKKRAELLDSRQRESEARIARSELQRNIAAGLALVIAAAFVLSR